MKQRQQKYRPQQNNTLKDHVQPANKNFKYSYFIDFEQNTVEAFSI